MKEAVVKTDTQIVVEGKKYMLKGITDLDINLEEKKIQYDLETEEPEKKMMIMRSFSKESLSRF